MRLYLHANQINPALSATLSGLKEAINTQEQKEAPEKNMSNSGAFLPLIEGYVLCTRPEEKFLPLQCSNGCACKPQSGQLWSVSCYFLSLSDTALLWHPVSSHVRYNSLHRVRAFVVQVHCLLCHGVTPQQPQCTGAQGSVEMEMPFPTLPPSPFIHFHCHSEKNSTLLCFNGKRVF